MADLDTRIPATLDTPTRILAWTPEQLALVVACIFLGIVMRDVITWIVIGVGLAFLYGKLTGGRHPRYMMHWLYWYTPIRAGMKATPPSHIREFIS